MSANQLAQTQGDIVQERPTADVEDQPPASPADALAIIDRQQALQHGDDSPFFLVWGAAWLIIGAVWFGAGQGAWPGAVAEITTLVTVVAGMVASAVFGRRMSKGLAGPSQQFGKLYGFGWFATMIATSALVAGLARSTDTGVAVLAPTLFVFVVGALYMLGGAFWRSVPDFALGLLLQVIAVVSVFTPLPWNSLVMGVGGGGALVVVGLWRRAQR